MTLARAVDVPMLLNFPCQTLHESGLVVFLPSFYMGNAGNGVLFLMGNGAKLWAH